MDFDLSSRNEADGDDGSRTLLSRRATLKGASALVGAGSVGALGLWYGTQPAVAAHVEDWTAGNTELVESDDGTLTAVNTAPAIDLDWNNFSNGADSVDITLTAHLRAADNDNTEDLSDVVYDAAGITGSTAGTDGVIDVTTVDAALDGANTNGGVTINLEAVDITDAFDADGSGETEAITEANFQDEDSSTANQITTVELQLETTVNGAQSAAPTADISTTFNVEVQNLAETQQTGGTAGTSAE